MSDGQTPFVDHAAPILAGDPAITDEQRSNLWDIFNQSKDANELAKRLGAPEHLMVPNDTKQRLFEKKRSLSQLPAAAPIDKVTDAIHRIAQMDPQEREVAETHPNLLKTFAQAATAPEKAAGEAAGEGGSTLKGKTQGKGAKPAPLVQPPRVDGLEHCPPIPDGHYRVRASDGGVHDIPAENIDKAREIDPRLMVMNP